MLYKFRNMERQSILFYGNCQLFAVLKTLNISEKYNTILIECWNSSIDKEYFTNTVKNSDIIITQPISDNYRDCDYLSTNYIIQNKKPECIVIIFDSLYFNFYYFDLTYKQFNNKLLDNPIAYHYNSMINCYLNKNPPEFYIDNYVNNVDLKTAEELNKIAENSLSQLDSRYIEYSNKYKDENIYTISSSDYIRLNYKNKLLFYSMNHPSKYLIQYISEQIINILKIKNTINYDVDILWNPKCILYKCISKCVNFKVDDHLPLTKNLTDPLKITELYYSSYESIDYK